MLSVTHTVRMVSSKICPKHLTWPFTEKILNVFKKMDILNKAGGVVSFYSYNPLKQRPDCDLFVFMHIFDASFLLQVTSLRKDMRRRGRNCLGHICHTLQVKAPTLTSHLKGHKVRLYPQTLNSWQNQIFYSRWVCLAFSNLKRS